MDNVTAIRKLSALENLKPVILDWLQTYPSMTAAQVHDWLLEHFGGIPKEIVVDQDSIIVVSENRGDIIYTYEFEQYKSQLSLDIRVCRKADPESKGMVESTVKYIKENFLPHRYFMEEEILALLSSPIEDQWHSHLKFIRERKPRYYRDQLTLLKQLIQSTSADVLEDAMLYCGIRELYSINDLKSAAEYMLRQ